MDLVKLREICLVLPGVTEDIKWEKNLCFMVGEKMFCIGALQEKFSIAFKVPNDKFDELSSSPDIIPAPYLARAKWIRVQSPDRFSSKEWADHLGRSYELIKAKLPKKLRDTL